MSRIYLSFLLLLFTANLTLAKSNQLQLTAEPATTQHILVLDSFQPGLPIPESIHKGLFSALRAGGFSVTNLYVEHLDFYRDPDNQGRAGMADRLQYKLANKQLDLVITIGPAATGYMAREGQSLFPDVAVLALISPNYVVLSSVYNEVMSIPWQVDLSGTVNTALNLFPATRKLFIITGAADEILPFLDEAKKALAPLQNKLEITYSNTLTYEEMLIQVASLPSDALIIYSPYFTDTKGHTFVPAEVAVKVSQSSPVPVFATLEEYLGSGIVGGSLLKTEEIGRHAGKIALDYLNGRINLSEHPSVFPPPKLNEFDWHELTRWKADPARLPDDSVFVNRPPTLWRQYKTEVIFVMGTFLALGVLITCLMVLNRNLIRARKVAIENELRYKEMIQSAPEAIVIYDFDLKRIVDGNSKAEQLFGCNREKLLQGGPERFYSLNQPDGKPVLESMNQRMLSALTGKDEVFERSVHIDQDSDLICEVRLVQLPSTGRRLLRGSFVDITERKQLEAERNSISTQLEVKVKELEEVVYVASHDLRSPLVTIEGFSGILGESLEEISSTLEKEKLSSQARAWLAPFFKDSHESIRYISQAASSMNSLLRGLLQISQLSRIATIKEKLDMNKLMSDVLAGFKYQTEEQKVQVNVSTLPDCEGNKRQVSQIFGNLIGNAFKYAHPERFCIINISGQKEKGLSTYCVEDNGLGIGPEYREEIFELFHQLNREDDGEGLGLSIVKKITEGHGGKIWVESELGKGSRFYVSL